MSDTRVIGGNDHRFAAYSAPRPVMAAGYATWGSRVAAAMIDSFLLFLALVLGIAVAAGLHSPALVVAAFLGIPAYYTLGHGSESGQTVGKRAMSIAVRGADDLGRIGYGRALWRFTIMWLLGVIPLVCILNLLAPLWSSRNQAWHDNGAATVVVATA